MIKLLIMGGTTKPLYNNTPINKPCLLLEMKKGGLFLCNKNVFTHIKEQIHIKIIFQKD